MAQLVNTISAPSYFNQSRQEHTFSKAELNPQITKDLQEHFSITEMDPSGFEPEISSALSVIGLAFTLTDAREAL